MEGFLAWPDVLSRSVGRCHGRIGKRAAVGATEVANRNRLRASVICAIYDSDSGRLVLGAQDCQRIYRRCCQPRHAAATSGCGPGLSRCAINPMTVMAVGGAAAARGDGGDRRALRTCVWPPRTMPDAG